MLKKIAISPESSNYGDNDENVAYLYRGYIIWKDTWINVGERGGNRDEWNFAPAVFHAPNAALGETFEPYWDSAFNVDARDSRRDCVRSIDFHFEQGLASPDPEAAQPDPDAVKNVTLTVSLNEARTILAALSRRHDELCLAVSTPLGDELLAEVKAAYQSVDQQTFHPANS